VKKVPIPDTNGIPPFADFDMLKGKINEIVQKYNNLLVNLDTLNVVTLNAKVIEAGTITADKMNVTELSAITANLGTIIAGIIRGISIYGSYIATAEGTYPRSEMDVAGNLFAAYQSATNSAKVVSNVAGTPRLVFSDSITGGDMFLFNFFFGSNFVVRSINCDLYLAADTGYNVNVDSWSRLFSLSDSQSLQTALDNLTSAINANTSAIATKATSGASTGSGGGATLNGGIPIGTSLSVSGGGSVTWGGISVPSHSHSQS
jgi:hypothetical protein